MLPVNSDTLASHLLSGRFCCVLVVSVVLMVMVVVVAVVVMVCMYVCMYVYKYACMHVCMCGGILYACTWLVHNHIPTKNVIKTVEDL